MQLMIWAGIVFCITQSAMFSGLNLTFFSISKLRLEIEVARGNRHAMKVLALRKDSNFLLTTILAGSDDNVIDNDIILFWGDNKKVITGADILGGLLRAIAEMRVKK
ncbi:MAG: DUF21 domain-containing protein [Syntrophaceae bacterium]|nr:DUF21 domain-containing protein [Syntrophaceae bacterium]